MHGSIRVLVYMHRYGAIRGFAEIWYRSIRVLVHLWVWVNKVYLTCGYESIRALLNLWVLVHL